jgi:RES domain-containing protein
VPVPEDWNADVAIAACPAFAGWNGVAWRFHKQKYLAGDHRGSLVKTGRYHRAGDLFQPEDSWPALYLALDRAIALGEVQRRLTPSILSQLNEFRLTMLQVALAGSVLGCDDPALLGLRLDDLCHDTDWDVPQRLAAAAIAHGAEALIVPSATRLGNNLIVFPTRRHPGSRIIEISHVDPRLYVDRP